MKQSSWPDVAAINQKNYYTYVTHLLVSSTGATGLNAD